MSDHPPLLHPSRRDLIKVGLAAGATTLLPWHHARADLPAIARRFAPKAFFAHLRNVTKEPDGSFVEADHLGGDINIVAVVEALLREEQRRRGSGMTDWCIPFRPDHGHELLDDGRRKTHPGYPLVGRLRGLAELRGVITAVVALNRMPV